MDSAWWCRRSETAVNPKTDQMVFGEGITPFAECGGCGQLITVAVIDAVFTLCPHPQAVPEAD